MKPTSSLMARLRRLKLTTKMANKGFYKGTGSGSMGRHTKHGGYVIEWHKVRTYVCPDLSDFKLTPFVTKKIKAEPGKFPHEQGGPMSATRYINNWAEWGSNQ